MKKTRRNIKNQNMIEKFKNKLKQRIPDQEEKANRLLAPRE